MSATTGKISYWENVENADALSLFEKRRNGLEGGVSGMFSGETITKMENADHAGFVLIFSSGRSALLSLRDAQSRPTVMVQFLKGEPRNARSGLFGGLKSALTGGSWLRSVVAAKSRISSTRGQMDLLLANEDARFQFWTLGWSGHTDFQGEIDVHQQLKEEIILELGSQVESALTVKLVDFALIRDLSSAVVRAAEGAFRIIALCEVAGSGSLQFVLADITLTVESVKISRILQLRSFAAPIVTEKHDKPKILTSESCQTALIAFEKALVMISLATFTNTPNLQIAAERDVVPEPFEETLYLRDDEKLYFTEADSEGASEPSGQAVVNLFVNARGIVRVVLPEPEDEHHAVQRHRISAKSRIEQAVYYGTKANNPFNLAKSSKLHFDSAEVEEAALAISKDIITSAGQSSSDVDIDVASHLAERASRLKSLALHLKHGYAPLSRKVRWLLSFDAEKIAAAQEIWRLYQVQQQDGIPEGKLLTELINMIDDRYNSPLDPSKGETDEVRHWFIKHVNHMDQLIMWAYQSFYELVSVEYEEPTPEVMAPLVHQADEMVLGSLSAAFQHRAANAWDYNLENEVMRDGLLQEGYEDLPEFWTSRFGLMSKIQELVDNSRDLVILCSHLEGEEQLLIERIAQDNPKLIDTVCRCWEERCRWQTAVDDPNTRAVAASLVQMYHTKRTDMIAKLHEIGMLDEAVHLGEKYKDMDSLVLLFRLTVLDAQKLQSPSEPPSSHEKGRVLIAKVAALERRWYAKFGKDWADTLYANLLVEEQYGHLLNQAGSKRKELTDFLREDASRKKFSWIHDILGERDYLHAAETLLDVADAGAQSTWSQQIDLSLSKLSLLATAEAAAETGTKQPNESALLARCNKELSVAQVRQRIYDMLHATTFQALDEQAEVTLVMEAYGSSREGSALGELLKQAVEALMQGPGPDVEQLLDLLTLLDRKPAGKSDSPSLSDEVFVLALEALASCDLAPESDRFQLLSASTWRRIFIQDDWHAINNTERQSDARIAERLAATCLFQVLYIGTKKCKSTLQCSSDDDVHSDKQLTQHSMVARRPRPRRARAQRRARHRQHSRRAPGRALPRRHDPAPRGQGSRAGGHAAAGAH